MGAEEPPQVYQRLLGVPPDLPVPIFNVQFGLLLRKDLHRAFDRLDFSFYVKEGPRQAFAWMSLTRITGRRSICPCLRGRSALISREENTSGPVPWDIRLAPESAVHLMALHTMPSSTYAGFLLWHDCCIMIVWMKPLYGYHAGRGNRF
jgi:hypothetical protein